jgi:hypothetical protein
MSPVGSHSTSFAFSEIFFFSFSSRSYTHTPVEYRPRRSTYAPVELNRPLGGRKDKDFRAKPIPQ